jgi:hypothetical protein
VRNSPQSFNLLLVDSDEAIAENETRPRFSAKEIQEMAFENNQRRALSFDGADNGVVVSRRR